MKRPWLSTPFQRVCLDRYESSKPYSRFASASFRNRATSPLESREAKFQRAVHLVQFDDFDAPPTVKLKERFFNAPRVTSSKAPIPEEPPASLSRP
jgi:hypothetical protein